MSNEYFANNWKEHVMGLKSGNTAFHVFEDEESERSEVQGALNEMENQGILEHTDYDHEKFRAFRQAVKENFEIPWTGISPRMQRTIYAINAIRKPQVVVCAGIFCGYTFICNAGASVGPGACYSSKDLFGFELLPVEAERAKANIEKLDLEKKSTVLSQDTADWLRNTDMQVDLLYIDAKPIDWERSWRRGEVSSEYYKIVNAAMPKLREGSLVLAHNSVNASDYLNDYLEFVRNEENFTKSINLIIDDAGLEVTLV